MNHRPGTSILQVRGRRARETLDISLAEGIDHCVDPEDHAQDIRF